MCRAHLTLYHDYKIQIHNVLCDKYFSRLWHDALCDAMLLRRHLGREGLLSLNLFFFFFFFSFFSPPCICIIVSPLVSCHLVSSYTHLGDWKGVTRLTTLRAYI
jgi:hypothetical protein